MLLYNKPGVGQKFLSWFGFIMVLAYMSLGVFVLSGNYYLKDALTPNIRIALGILFIIYGIFRAWRLYKKINSFKKEDEIQE